MSTLSKNTTKKNEDWQPSVQQDGAAALLIQRGALAELFNAWMIAPTDSGLVQFLRYGVVGGVAFVCDFGTLYAVTSLVGVHYLISAVIGFAVGLLVNYWLSVRWVFGTRKFTSGFVQFGLFALVGIVGVGLNELVMWLLTDRVGWHYLASKLAATGLVYLWNFSIRKVLIF